MEGCFRVYHWQEQKIEGTSYFLHKECEQHKDELEMKVEGMQLT